MKKLFLIIAAGVAGLLVAGAASAFGFEPQHSLSVGAGVGFVGFGLATVNTWAMTQAKRFGNTPFGNQTTLPYSLTVNASGVAQNTDQSTALQIADVVRLGILPAGMTLWDIDYIISTAMTAATTFKLGFLYTDGVDSTVVPQNDAYFIPAGQSAATAAILRKTATTAPVTLPKDAYLVITLAGAAQAKASQTDIAIKGVLTGDIPGSLASQQVP